MARKRTKMFGLVSHTQPDGYSRMGEREVLMKKFNACNITPPELKKLACFLVVEKKTTKTIKVRVWGKGLTLTIEEYNKYYKPLF